ncbi:hypothetical protein [Streptomyces lavendofoliae]|uniref:Uncharacterized protein n=1 Tax=Streptomyces lavendofoliae TaxID=67314 RepID=A0A918I127_9ACTN|nr:hypothetical protein [Streptomyces lavendofoliae]GGU52399.1 hypothetical protein GCM10010274_46650 [Streptomyces lavendofoliae]
MEPSIHGHELSPGDELGHDTAPTCCGGEMDPTNSTTYRCGHCGTVLEVNGLGLVSDIR